MGSTIKIETDKLKIIALSHDHLGRYTLPNALEKALGLTENNRTVPDRLKTKIHTEILPKIKIEHPDNLFYTFWIVIIKPEHVIAGEFCFKGIPNRNGEVEIGYATYNDFRGKGVMTEAVKLIAEWVFMNTNTEVIIAETHPENIPSQRILEKNNFTKCEMDSGHWIWKLKK